jgi:hypothetical protein
MTSRDFCYWLQGFFELSAAGKHPDDGSLTNVQGDAIRRHLALVFKHEIDPSAGPPEHQTELNKIHAAQSSTPVRPQIGGVDPTTGLVYRC